MAISALMGQKPLSADDILIARGLRIVAPTQVNPKISEPFGTPAPPNADHNSHATTLIIGEVFAIFFIALFTLARLFVRKWRTHFWGPDDWMIIPGALGGITYLALDIVTQTRGCLGKHIWNCTYDEVAWFIYIGQIQEPMFYFTVFSVKLSIALANQRLTGLASKTWQYIHRAFIGTFLCLLPITTFLNMFQCLPVPAGYSLWYVGGIADPASTIHCLNRTSISYGTRILHILTDVALLCVPIVIVLRLQMPKVKKYRLVAVFAIGGASTLASIVRNVFVHKALGDFTYQGYIIWCFDIVDITFAVVVASLPALNGLVESALQRLSTLRSSKFSKGASFGTSSAWRRPRRVGSEAHLARHAGSAELRDEEWRSESSHSKTFRVEQPTELTAY
ncbi:hypothetical protein EAF04_002189 [Stromatinia cepivora]|nr:hypothetical protein EAF04_002189 [Stromatinia cepivora]